MQLEQEYEEKQTVLHEKQDLEGLVSTLCEQVRTRPGWCFHEGQTKQNWRWSSSICPEKQFIRFCYLQRNSAPDTFVEQILFHSLMCPWQ